MNQKRVKSLLLALSLSCFSISHALENDHNQKVFLKANAAEYNAKTGEGLYQGKVQIDQGSSHLTADRAKTKTDKHNRLVKASAYGSAKQPVHFWTKINNDKPSLHAYAQQIDFYPDSNKIILRGNALIQQGKDTYRAPVIEYDTKAQHIISSASHLGRTTIVLHPKQGTA